MNSLHTHTHTSTFCKHIYIYRERVAYKINVCDVVGAGKYQEGVPYYMCTIIYIGK